MTNDLSQSKSAKDQAITAFCSITGASQKDAKRYLDTHKRLDVATDAFYQDGGGSRVDSGASTSKLNALFQKYKDADGETIAIDGTVKFCEDLEVDPEDIVLLSIAYELKSPRVGEWSKKGWIDGWKNIGCDTIDGMKSSLTRLRAHLGSDPTYFRQVYNYTFTFARSEGQRSLVIETALAYWELLLPFGLAGGALKHVPAGDDGDVNMDGEEGWQSQHTDWWLEFMREKGGKGVSKDTWQMLTDFIRSIDGKFEKHDATAAWPSAIDDFVDWVKKEKLKK